VVAASDADARLEAAAGRPWERFCLTLAAAAASSAAAIFLFVVKPYDALALSFQATSRLPGRARTSLPHHRAILEAIRDKDAPRAARVMRRLVQNTAGEIEALRGSERTRR